MSSNLLLDCDMAPDHPPCWNRPPVQPVSVRYGIDSATGEVISVEQTTGWFNDRCATWDGVGIGQPTVEYPSGTPYPVAHGWDGWCKSCRWYPAKEAK